MYVCLSVCLYVCNILAPLPYPPLPSPPLSSPPLPSRLPQRDKETKRQKAKMTNKKRQKMTKGITECILKRIYHSWAQLSYKIIQINIQPDCLNSVKYEIGFRLEGFFFSVFFFIIHLLPKLNRLHLRSYGRWSWFSLFSEGK